MSLIKELDDLLDKDHEHAFLTRRHRATLRNLKAALASADSAAVPKTAVKHVAVTCADHAKGETGYLSVQGEAVALPENPYYDNLRQYWRDGFNGEVFSACTGDEPLRAYHRGRSDRAEYDARAAAAVAQAGVPAKVNEWAGESRKHMRGDYAYASGWNACREAMLAAAPQPQPATRAAVDPADITVESFPSTPSGGMSAGMPAGVKVTHKPTGCTVAVGHLRSQHHNRSSALRALTAALHPENNA